jgi:hypothetical protein
MSCGCCTPNITIAPTICCTPTTESVEYSAENQNLIGVGVFNEQTGTQFGFRGIASDTLALTVTHDVANNAIIISFNDELLIDDIPTATETIRGIAEVATQGETNAGALDDKIVTPLKLFSMLATETQRGILEIATQAEVTTGTNDTNAVTPLKLTTFAGTQKVTRTFADAVARAAAVPNFDGQLGIQLDTNALIMSTGTIAGAFTPNIVIGGTLSVTGLSTFTGDISAASSLATFSQVQTTDISVDSGVFSVTGGLLFVNGPLSFEAGTQFQIGGAPASDSVLIGRTLGAADALPLADFLSTENVQTGYTNFANPAVLRTCDTATVTLPQLAQIVGTLINDLKAVQLPAT